LIKFRDQQGRLIGAMLADRLNDGLSAVYSFFSPKYSSRGIGTLMILWLINKAKDLDLPYVYLGFWIDGCGKMDYKSRFQPLEVHSRSGWQPFADLTA